MTARDKPLREGRSEIRYRTFGNSIEIVPVEVVTETDRLVTVRVPGLIPRNKRLVRYNKGDDFTVLHRTAYEAKAYLGRRLAAKIKALQAQIHRHKLDLRIIRNMRGSYENKPPSV